MIDIEKWKKFFTFVRENLPGFAAGAVVAVIATGAFYEKILDP